MQIREYIRRFLDTKQIESERLVLRKLRRTDAEDMFAYASLPRSSRYLSWSEHPDIIHTKRYLTYLESRYRAAQFFDFAIVLRDSGRMIGTIGFVNIDETNNLAEVGYVLHPDFWNCGIMTEALSCLLRFGFEEVGLHRIEAMYMEENLASRRVMEKCGMTFEGIQRQARFIKGAYCNVGVCAVLESEWRKFYDIVN